KGSPPVFLYHATGDRLVRPEHAWAMMQALDEKKVRHEIHWIRGRGHIAAFLMPGDSVEMAIAFLDRETHRADPLRSVSHSSTGRP
ncbi:MAG: hypothetical protein EOP85_17065, partial [Verrucomicrobiaceae bacterium]